MKLIIGRSHLSDSLSGLSFEEIWDQNKLIGYVLLSKDYIDEIAFADGTTDKSILASLNKIQNKFIENLTLVCHISTKL